MRALALPADQAEVLDARVTGGRRVDQLVEPDLAAQPLPLQPRPDRVEGAVRFVAHPPISPFGKEGLPVCLAEVIIGAVTHEFGKDYWEQHWGQRPGEEPDTAAHHTPNPYLVRETAGLTPGTALDAGCGTGAEAIWLASRGWQVTAADIAAEALGRAAKIPGATRVRWIEADLTTWQPGTQFDLVTTSYAHPAIAQLAFYQRISGWVAPGGTLLIVGHRHSGEAAGPGHPPARASVTAAGIAAALDRATWDIVTAEEDTRTLAGHPAPLLDAVVRAMRISPNVPI